MIIFLFGDDQFRSSQKVAEIKSKYLKSDKSGSGLSFSDFSEKAEAKKIIDIFSTPNLLAPKRLVIIKRLIGSGAEAEQESMLEYLKKSKKTLPEDKDVVAVFWEEGVPKKTNKLARFLQEVSKKQEFPKLTGAKLEQWIMNRMKELDGNSGITRPAMAKLTAYCANDTLSLNLEIQKLVNYADSKLITEEDVEILVKANVDANIFDTVDAIGANNKKRAFELLHKHLEKGDDPFYLMSMFVYQFRNLLKVADLRERNLGEFEISKIAKLHPYVVKKSIGQLRNFSLDRLKKIYGELLQIDTKIKTGRLDIKVALDKFVAEL